MKNTEEQKQERQRSTPFLIILLSSLCLLLILLRIARLDTAVHEHFYSISGIKDFLFVLFTFLQDILLCFFLFLVFKLLLKISSKKQIRLLFTVLITMFSYFIFFLTFADLFFFETFAKPMTWNGISSELAGVGNFKDSALSMFSPFLTILAVGGILLLGPGTFIIHKRISKKMKFGIVKFQLYKVEYLMLIAFTIILSSNALFFIPNDELKQGLKTQPIYKVFSTFFSRRSADDNQKISENGKGTDDVFYSAFSTNSQRYSLDPLDRKVQLNIKETIKAAEQKNYNVVFYLCESVYAGRLKTYGAEKNVMPNIDRLSSKALVLNNMYSTSVRSMNSLVSLLTGLGGYPGFSVLTEVNPRIETPAMSQVLHDRGYSTALIHAGSFAFYEKLKFLEDRDFDLLVDEAYLKKRYPDAWTFSWGIDDSAMVAEGLKWIDSQTKADKNFFLTFVPILPHHPYDIPPGSELYNPDAKRSYDKYLNSLYYVDQQFNYFYEQLEKRDLLENTIIVFIGDHGEAFGRLHKGNYGHSNNILEENIKVPGFIFNPVLFDRSYEFNGIVNTSDIYPTILDILNIERADWIQGESILEMNTAKMSFVGTGNYDILIALRDGDFKATYNFDKDSIQLYSIKNGEVEENDISTENEEISLFYKGILKDYYLYQTGFFEHFNENVQKMKVMESGKSSINLLDLTPSFYAQNNYSYMKNKTAKGNRIFINGEEYKTGIGVYANSVLQYNLEGLDAEQFSGSVGKVDLSFANTDIRNARIKAIKPSEVQHYVEMIIKVDGILKFTSGKITNKQPVIPFTADISGAKSLELIVYDAGDGDVDDNCVWLNPEIIRFQK